MGNLRWPHIPTKSGLMLGLGETEDEVVASLEALREASCDRITIGQYLRPSLAHLPVQRYWHPEAFDRLGQRATEMGFSHVRRVPRGRSIYHAAMPAAAGSHRLQADSCQRREERSNT